jgi:hypothetical protein
VEEKGKLVAKFNIDGWMCEVAFIVDVTTHMNELNTHMQIKHQLISSVFDHIKAFIIKLHVWESQPKNKNFVHCLTLLKCNIRDSQKYVIIILELREES